MKKTLVSTGLALATSLAFGAVEKQTFESAEVGTKPAGWTGDASVAASGVTARGMVLAVDGEATCANDGEAKASQWGKSSFIVKVPEDGVEMTDLPNTTTDEKMSGCQIAVATGPAITEGENAGKLNVMVYCGATNPAWIQTTAVVSKSTDETPVWMAVDIDCDYAAGKAEVFVNGSSAGSYALVSGTANKSKVSSLVFVGSSQVDDVAIAETDAVPADVLPDAIKTLPSIDLAAQGITLAQIVANAKVGTSGLTVQQKLECGLDPTDNSTFTAQAIAPAADGKVAVVVPYAFNNGQAYTVVMTDETGASTTTVVDPVLDNVNKTATLTVKPGSGKVLKIQVKAAAPAPAAK